MSPAEVKKPFLLTKVSYDGFSDVEKLMAQALVQVGDVRIIDEQPGAIHP